MAFSGLKTFCRVSLQLEIRHDGHFGTFSECSSFVSLNIELFSIQVVTSQRSVSMLRLMNPGGI